MTNTLTADASPEKRLFISLLTRDISLVAAFLDLIDNSINAALAPYADKLTTAEDYISALDDPEISVSTSIEIEFSAESVKITDDATGIDAETAQSYVFNPLERSDVDLIVAALNYYKDQVRSYDNYPSYEFRQAQLDRIDETLGKLRAIADEI